MTLTAVALVAALSTASPDTLSHTETVFLLSVGADMSSTLMQGRQGFDVPDWYGWCEDNPIGAYLLRRDRSNGLFIAGGVAYAIGTVYLTRRLSESPPKTAKAVLVCLTLAPPYFTAKNSSAYFSMRLRYGRDHP